MENRFPVGAEGIWETAVTDDITADALGNKGVKVLATPCLCGLAEMSCVESINRFLAPGEATVGSRLEIFHLAPTPLGMKVTVRARLARVEGRKLFFQYEAHDEVDKVAEGTHDRVVVDLQRILDKAAARRKV